MFCCYLLGGDDQFVVKEKKAREKQENAPNTAAQSTDELYKS
jgi:hypothetical protein